MFVSGITELILKPEQIIEKNKYGSKGSKAIEDSVNNHTYTFSKAVLKDVYYIHDGKMEYYDKDGNIKLTKVLILKN